MSMSGVNKAIATINAVAKKSTKVFANALPIVSVGSTIYDAYQVSGGKLDDTLHRTIEAFTGINKNGQFSGDKLAMGTGRLLGTVAVRWALKQFV